MIHIQAGSANDAWRMTIRALLEQGSDTGNQKYLRDEMTVIELNQPKIEPADPHFPMSQADLDVITRYIYTGENEDAVTHEWTKLYYHRIFDEPHSQIRFLVSKLDAANPVAEAQASIWDKNIDQDAKVNPCTQIIWARIKHGKLETHVHANSTDSYKKLLMNMLEFISLQAYIADQAGVPVGPYYHFVDSCHLHRKDQGDIDELLTTLQL